MTDTSYLYKYFMEKSQPEREENDKCEQGTCERKVAKTEKEAK